MSGPDFRGVEALRAALRLYVITPDSWATAHDYAVHVEAALRGGATAVQYRRKAPLAAAVRDEALRALRALCSAHGAMFVVNDDPALALAAGADAVHVGPGDVPVEAVFAAAGDRLVVGSSAGTVARASSLYGEGVDYLGVGAIFDARGSKADASAPRGPDVLAEMRATPLLQTLPIVAIGGITEATAASCVAAGADGVAVIREVFGAGDVETAARRMRAAVDAGARGAG
jgi:thiamine-phosphate pyrophosphorylase